MAISDPSVVAFVNEVVRPFSDVFVGFNSDGEIRNITWNNVVTQSAEWIAAADGDLIVDGSATDGRTPLSKADVTNFWAQVQVVLTQMNGGGVADVVTKPMVNVRTPTS